MNKEKAELFSAALRSGKFPQGKHRLESDGEFCCLGVASFLASEAGACIRLTPEKAHAISVQYGRDTVSLPKEVHEWLELEQPYSGNILFEEPVLSAVEMNDSGNKDFNFIADMIDLYWESL